MPGPSVLIYGDTKVGKTLDACHAMKKAVVVLAEPDGLASVQSNLGYMPPHIELLSVDQPEQELRSAFATLQPALMSGEYSGVIIDTGSELSARLADSYAERFPKDKYGVFSFAAREVKRFVRNVQTTPAAIVMLCHEKKPANRDNVFYKGGPQFPSGAMTQAISGMFSIVMRACHSPGKGRVYQCLRNTTQWFMGDRYGATADEQALDLRPILWRMIKGDAPQPDWPEKPIRVVEPASGLAEQVGEDGAKAKDVEL